jgi:prevent-host-death family protein
MPFSVTEDIRSVSELKRDTKKIFRQLHETGRPVVVTVKGKPDVVLLDAAVYEKRLAEANLHRLLAEGEADIRAGRVRAAREAIEEISRRAGL